VNDAARERDRCSDLPVGAPFDQEGPPLDAGPEAAAARPPQTLDDDARTRELGRFLKIRRARIRPDQVGFPVGPRRRSTGLRREEVAVLAGVSPTWYTYLEQGRKIRPSPEVLDSLATVLNLTEDERRYIHLLALGHPPANSCTGPTLTDDSLAWAVIESIGAGPDPVYIANQYGDLAAWNEAVTTWFTDFRRYPRPRRNMLWWMLTAPEARDRVVDWKEDTRDVVARLRAAYATRPQDAAFARTVSYMAEASPDFQRWWAEHDVREQRPRLRVLHTPETGIRVFRIVALRLSDGSTNSAVLHLPVDSETSSAPIW
jgi:transcriptional regulator with XRE-family HTH domain